MTPGWDVIWVVKFLVIVTWNKFKHEFKQICTNYGIIATPTTSHIPQANAIIERMNKVVNNMLRSFDLEKENLNEYNPLHYFF
jgi:transposase